MNINNLRSKINYECSKFRWDALCLDIDLSSKLHNLPQSKYIITQNILNGMKQYTIINTWKNKILYPDDDFNIRLIDSNGKQVKTSMKKIVRLIYDSEYCVDDIEDEPESLGFH